MRVFLGAISLAAITSALAADQCSTSLLCCSELDLPTDPRVTLLLATFGIELGPNPGTVGLNCLFTSPSWSMQDNFILMRDLGNPLTTGNTCSGNRAAVCCQSNFFVSVVGTNASHRLELII